MRNLLERLEGLDESSRLDDVDLAISRVKKETPSRSHSRSYATIIKDPGLVSIRMDGQNARKEKTTYIVTLTKTGGQWDTMVSVNDDDPVDGAKARSVVQAAGYAAKTLEKLYFGE